MAVASRQNGVLWMRGRARCGVPEGFVRLSFERLFVCLLR